MSETKNSARTRFAPSPTGYVHVGGIRTALFAWLLARQTNGQFILRLEDTDKSREVKGSAQHIMDSLKWLGLEWDEGPDINGEFGPYIQSERLSSYKEWAQKLIAKGRAYVDTYTTDEINQFREDCIKNKKPFLFRNYRPAKLDTPWDGTKPLRFLSDPKTYKWQDAVMGNLSAGMDAIDDFIIMKSDGYPTYNFAHIIDDYEMKITHVIRSQEFIASTPKYLNLYEALGFDVPTLVTLPFVMAIDGKKKLGKRDGAKDVLDYAREGVLPETMINFLALLGWNDGTEQEIFSVDDLIEKFDISRVQKSPARFDENRLWWMNGMHIRRLDIDELINRTTNLWPKSAEDASDELKKRVLVLIHDRLKKITELSELTNFFFEDPTYNNRLKDLLVAETKLDNIKITNLLKSALDVIERNEFTIDSLHDELYKAASNQASKPGEYFKIIRIAAVGGTVAPGLFETLSALGKETVTRRLNKTIELLQT